MRSMPTGKVFAILELVGGAAIGALGLAAMTDIQRHFGVTIPDGHVGRRAWADKTTLPIQLGGQ